MDCLRCWRSNPGSFTGGSCAVLEYLCYRDFYYITYEVDKMNPFLKAAKQSIWSFAKEDEGAQVVEYALIIAVVSIALVLALKTAFGTTPFSTFLARVTKCLDGSATCV